MQTREGFGHVAHLERRHERSMSPLTSKKSTRRVSIPTAGRGRAVGEPADVLGLTNALHGPGTVLNRFVGTEDAADFKDAHAFGLVIEVVLEDVDEAADQLRAHHGEVARDRVQETDGLFVVGEVLFPGFGHEREVDEFLIAELGHLYAQGVFGALPFERALHRGGRDGRTIGKLFVAVETRHLFDEILLDFDVEAVGGRHHREDVPFARPFKAQAREDRLHGVDGDLHSDHLEAAVHAHRDGLAFGKLRDDVVDRTHLGFGRAADVENELSDVFEVRRVRAEVDAAFVAVGGVRREVELAGTT